jgi:hypothetical protein
LDFYSQQWQFTLFYISPQCQGCHNFGQHTEHIEIFWGKVTLSLYLAEIDTVPNRLALDVDPDPDPAK